jgi:POT family proton-dependent oligopeptide transporter
MTKYVLLPAQAGHVIGLASFKSAPETVSGPLEVQPLASQIYGFRLLGQRRMVIIGATLMAIGHFLMALEPLLLERGIFRGTTMRRLTKHSRSM